MSLSVDITKKHKNFMLSVKFETADTTLGILGASGCGKSMTLKAIAGIITPDSGRIVLNDKVLFDSQLKVNLMPQQRKVGYLFQNYALFPNMTVEQNIAAGMNGKSPGKKAKIDELMDAFHLTKRKEQYPNQLSGGQQQRVALARILASDTDILLLDEPFSALDSYLKEQLQEQMLEMIHNYGKDVIMVTHNRDEAFRFCPDLLVMDHGNIVCEGNLKEIFNNPRYLVAARLTGCKNYSKAEKVSEHEIYAADWDIRLQIQEAIPDQLSHVGIRAHYLKAVLETDDNHPNLFEPEVVELMEDPFEINLMIRNKNNNIEKKDHIIWWKLSKEQWYGELHEKVPKYLELPEKNLLLLIQ